MDLHNVKTKFQEELQWSPPPGIHVLYLPHCTGLVFVTNSIWQKCGMSLLRLDYKKHCSLCLCSLSPSLLNYLLWGSKLPCCVSSPPGRPTAQRTEASGQDPARNWGLTVRWWAWEWVLQLQQSLAVTAALANGLTAGPLSYSQIFDLRNCVSKWMVF